MPGVLLFFCFLTTFLSLLKDSGSKLILSSLIATSLTSLRTLHSQGLSSVCKCSFYLSVTSFVAKQLAILFIAHVDSRLISFKNHIDLLTRLSYLILSKIFLNSEKLIIEELPFSLLQILLTFLRVLLYISNLLLVRIGIYSLYNWFLFSAACLHSLLNQSFLWVLAQYQRFILPSF